MEKDKETELKGIIIFIMSAVEGKVPPEADYQHLYKSWIAPILDFYFLKALRSATPTQEIYAMEIHGILTQCESNPIKLEENMKLFQKWFEKKALKPQETTQLLDFLQRFYDKFTF